MGFFDDIPPPPPPDNVMIAPPTKQPPWNGPPNDCLPVFVPTALELARTDDFAAVVAPIAVYPEGLLVTLHMADAAGRLSDFLPPGRGVPPGDPDPRVRFGVELSDGTRVTNVGEGPSVMHMHRPDLDDVPTGPVLRGGGRSSWSHGALSEYWLWPLPEADVTFGFELVARDVPESTAVLRGSLVAEAAARL